MACLNLNRSEQAVDLLETVQRAGLVVEGDDEFRRFTNVLADARRRVAAEANRVAEAARAEAARAEAVRAEAARAETARAETARGEAVRAEAARGEAARAEAVRAEAARAETARGEAVRAEAARAETARAEAARAETARVETARAEAARGEAARAETARGEAARAETARAEAARDAAARDAEAAAVSEQLERSALLAFYRGDYNGARAALDQLISQTPSARAYLFRASSQVAAGLLGSEDQTVWLTPPAEDYQRAVRGGADPETYREFISPRILQLLRDARGR